MWLLFWLSCALFSAYEAIYLGFPWTTLGFSLGDAHNGPR